LRVAAGVACALALLPAGAVGAGSSRPPRCFGAASRDPEHPCRNPALARRVTPRPEDAVLQPEATCDPPPPSPGPPPPCTFGVPADGAASTMLLLGDSHATHWRPALDVVAERLRWHAISLTRSSCPFSEAAYDEPEPKRSQCTTFNHDVVTFAEDHPEVQTVVVSEDHEPFVAAPGSSARAQQMAGFAAAWRALPDTVRHIVVIRDVTYERPSTPGCVDRALRHHRDAGTACALPRASALKRDLAVAAARRERATDPASRVSVVDLTPFLCGRRLCYPVVGGVLVHKDPGHLTILYAQTLGPYLLRGIGRVLSAAAGG
jgi:hypothetical protein